MDKKTIIGLVLMVAVFIGFTVYQSNEAEEYNKQLAAYKKEQAALQRAEAERRAAEAALSPEEQAMRDSLAQVEAEIAKLAAANADNINFGASLIAARDAEAQEFSVENDLIKVDFSTRGGMIRNVTLKEYYKYAEGERTELVELMQPETARFNMELRSANGTPFNSENYTFATTTTQLEDGTQEVVMALDITPEARMEYVYKIYNTGNPSRDYVIDFAIRQRGMAPHVSEKNEISIVWENRANHNERGFQNENMASTITFWENEDDEMEEMDSDGSNEHHANIGWVALKQQYFSSVFLSAEPLNADMSFVSSTNGGLDYLKAYKTHLYVAFSAEQPTYNFAFYYGPNDFKILKGVTFNGEDAHLEDLIPMGGWLVGWINRILTIPVFNWLKDHGVGFGLIILILTLLIKLIILPLTYKSYMSTAKMRAIRPELEALNAKYPKQEDAMKKQQATMQLYQQAGINPMGGCLPLLIQMPILWAMFRFFPASIELRGEGFLWADDLSSYDSVLELPFSIPFYGSHVSLFALLMAVAMFGYSFLTYKQQAATTAGQPGAGMMKFMMVYFMPVMMLFFFNNYSSGLCYYYFLSQIMTMIIMWAIRRTVDDEKVRAKLFAAKSKPRKKSKFQERYEEALRQQQEQMTINREQRRMKR